MQQNRESEDLLPEPPGWQDDNLSKFFQCSTNNIYRIFFRYQKEWKLLADIDKTFDKLTGNLDRTPHQTSLFLSQRSHSAYLAALRLLLATQYVDAFGPLRSSLEYALYALYFRDHPEALEHWSNRHESDEARKLARRLTFTTMLKYLSAQDVDLGSRAQRLYDETIDLGAHPNPDAVALAYGQEELTDGSGFEHGMNYLAGEGFGLMVALKTATDVGILSIAVVSCAFPSYARDLGVLQEVEELTKRVQGE